MLGIASWQDAAAAAGVILAIAGLIAAVVRFTVVGPLRSEIQQVANRLDSELAPIEKTSVRDKVVRHDAAIKRIEGTT